MAIKALVQYGLTALARDLAVKVVRQQVDTWRNYTPHTIWEAYSPTAAEPATAKSATEYSRPDFCGWSALGPIGLAIENLLGIYLDAPQNEIVWNRCCGGRHGLLPHLFTKLIFEILK
jgi:hypothetical protein